MESPLNTANNANRTSVEIQKNGKTGGEGDGNNSNCKITILTNDPEQQLLNKSNIRLCSDPLAQQQTSTLLYDDRGPSYSKNNPNTTVYNAINNNNNDGETVVSVSSTPLPPQQLQKSPELILGVGELTNPGNNSSIMSISLGNSSNNNNNHIINNPDYSTNHVSKNINSNNNSKWIGSKRNVSFPDDSSIVTGFSEPCNPWKNAPIYTAEELVVAYKKGCELNGVKPWNKIIQQLLGVQNCCNRHKTLNLKGEKLDQKHCEALEDIFRRVQFENLELEACHLDDETAAALFDMIEYYDSTTKLNLSFNKNIGMRGWQSCSRMIRKTPSLSHLDARGCELNNDHIIPVLGRSLKMGSNLTVLHLEYTYLSGRPLVILVAALKVNEILQELFLGDNKLMASDGIQIGNLLKFNHKLQLLDLRNNHFQDDGLSHICKGFCEKVNSSGLSTLVLWNNQISYQAMSALSCALSSVECLETLNLGHNSITNEGIHYLKEGLLKNKSLIRLGLQGTKVLCEGAVALAEYIADSSRLLRIDLRENDIRTAGLMALSLALKVNESLVRLELDRNTKKEVAVKDYADQQRRLLQDINNYLERNHNLAIKREKEEREKEKNKAQEAAKKEEEKVAKEQMENLESVYIPTCTKIRRPTLLFPGDPSPQHTLDSPAFIPDNEIINQLNSQFSPASPMSITTPPPPGAFLLSPQYCENTKAKKIFTVTKVGDVAFQRSPTSGSLPTSAPGLMPSASSMDQIMLSLGSEQASSATLYSSQLSGPTEIRKEIAAETVCGLFGILSESETTDTCQMLDTRCEMPDYNFQNNKNYKNKSVNEHPNPCQQLDSVNIEHLEFEKAIKQDTSLKQDTFLPTEQKVNICKQPIPCLSNDTSHAHNNRDNTNSVQSTVENVSCLADRNNIDCIGNRKVDICTKDGDNSPGKISNEINRESENIYLAAESFVTKCDKKHDQPVATDLSKTCAEFALTDDEMSSNSLLLNNQNGCLLQKMSTSQVDKPSEKRPEFHSNLSLNGMTQELANVLDSLELETNCKPDILSHTFKTIQTDTVTSPAEYEKELDDMLAHVQQGYNVKS